MNSHENWQRGPRGDAGEFKRLRDEYKYDKKAEWTKYNPDYFLKISAHCMALEHKGLSVFKEPEVAERVNEFKALAHTIAEEGQAYITDEHVKSADEFLNYIISKLENV